MKYCIVRSLGANNSIAHPCILVVILCNFYLCKKILENLSVCLSFMPENKNLAPGAPSSVVNFTIVNENLT